MLHVATYSIIFQVIFYGFTKEEHSIVLGIEKEQEKKIKKNKCYKIALFRKEAF